MMLKDRIYIQDSEIIISKYVNEVNTQNANIYIYLKLTKTILDIIAALRYKY